MMKKNWRVFCRGSTPRQTPPPYDGGKTVFLTRGRSTKCPREGGGKEKVGKQIFTRVKPVVAAIAAAAAAENPYDRGEVDCRDRLWWRGRERKRRGGVGFLFFLFSPRKTAQ